MSRNLSLYCGKKWGMNFDNVDLTYICESWWFVLDLVIHTLLYQFVLNFIISVFICFKNHNFLISKPIFSQIFGDQNSSNNYEEMRFLFKFLLALGAVLLKPWYRVIHAISFLENCFILSCRTRKFSLFYSRFFSLLTCVVGRSQPHQKLYLWCVKLTFFATGRTSLQQLL